MLTCLRRPAQAAELPLGLKSFQLPMHHSTHRRHGPTLLAALLLSVASSTAVAQSAAVVHIGVAMPLSGPLEPLGTGVLRGAQLAVDEINAAGGIKAGGGSFRLALVGIDDRGDANDAAQVAIQLASQRVVAVVGHLSSASSTQAALVYAEAGIAQVSPSSSHPFLTRMGYETVNRVVGNDRRQGEIMALYAVKKLKSASVAVITDDSEYGDVLVRAFANAADLLGARVVFNGAIPQGSANVAAALATVKAVGPDAVYFGGMTEQAVEIAVALRGLGFKGPLLLGDGACEEAFIAAAAGSAANMHCTVGEPGVERLPQGRAFAARYRKRFGVEPTVYAPYAYDAVQAIAQALRVAGDTEPQAVVEALRAVNLQGVTGPIAFDRRGDLVDAPFSVFRTDGKRLRFVETIR